MKKFKNIVKTVLFNKIIRLWRKNINEYSLRFINASLKELKLKNTDKCLVFAPHADDESIGLGGLLIKHHDIFSVICVTNCETGNPKNKNRNVTIKEREEEFKNAMEFISIEKFQYNFSISSDNLKYSQREFNKLLKKINLNAYTYVFLPHFFDQHPDHLALTRLFHKFCSNHSVESQINIAFYEVWTPMTSPNYFVDISNLIDKKTKLINIYKSQTRNIDYGERIKGLNVYRGMIPNVDYAECFQLMSLKDFVELSL